MHFMLNQNVIMPNLIIKIIITYIMHITLKLNIIMHK